MLNNTNSSQQGMLQESPVQQTGQEMNSEPVFTFPPLSGFWRRLFAWLIDMLLLGVTGHLLAIVFSSFLFRIGPYGRPIGLLFIIPYFGILNSKIGGGQTVGNRWLSIAVRNRDNQPIELWRAIIRISILALPFLFNQWAIPILQNPVLAWFLTLIIFGLGGAILYTMIFNRKARQGLHDMLVGTYVVHLPGKPISSFPTTARIHWIVVSAWFGLIAIATLAMTWALPSLVSKTSLASAKGLYDILQEDPRFFTVGVNDQTFYDSNGRKSRFLNITAWYKGRISESDREEVVTGIVKTVLDHEKNIHTYDGIRVNITSAYDIGIAKGHLNFWIANSVEGWQREIYPNGSSNGSTPFFRAYVFTTP